MALEDGEQCAEMLHLTNNDESCRKWWLGCLPPVLSEGVEDLDAAVIFAKKTRNPCVDCRSKL